VNLRDPLLPQSTVTGQRPSFVFDPTFHRIRTSDPRIRSPPLCPLSYGRART
jgi:hypothetical protein